MSSYTIVKIGNAYVVRVDNQDLLTTPNRRKAERLVMQALQLLEAPPLAGETKVEAAEACVAPDAA